jgi:biotin operon repressor
MQDKKTTTTIQPENFSTLISICKILLDEERLKILGCLAQEAHSMEMLAKRLGLKPAALSRQLAKLQEAGLAHPVPPNLYRLDLKNLHTLKKDLFALEKGESDGEQNADDKILNAFLDGERLKHLPSKSAKLQVVLNWLANKFDPEVRYPERAVNQILQRHHPDYASLRRFLVDYGFMQRQAGIYWRVETKQTE